MLWRTNQWRRPVVHSRLYLRHSVVTQTDTQTHTDEDTNRHTVSHTETLTHSQEETKLPMYRYLEGLTKGQVSTDTGGPFILHLYRHVVSLKTPSKCSLFHGKLVSMTRLFCFIQKSWNGRILDDQFSISCTIPQLAPGGK